VLRGWQVQRSVRDRRISVNLRREAVADGVVGPAGAVEDDRSPFM
jgi:hypothetical protein